MRRVTCVILFTAILSGQTSDAVSRMQQLTSLPVEGGSRVYLLGPGDLLEISVLGAAELTQLVRISPAGTITLPLIGQVVAAGLSTDDLQVRLADILRERKLVREPHVIVFTKEYRSQPVYVLGAVNQPGQYMVTTQLRLLDAIAMAGGLDMKRAGNYLLLQRRPNADEKPSDVLQNRESIETAGRVKIDLDALLEKGDLSLNLSLQGGDVIQVPEKELSEFYVVGDVQRAGAFPMPRKNVTVLTALSMAGGYGRTAKPERARILREVAGETARMHIEVDIKKIMLGKGEDIVLKSEDVLVIPTSGSKAFQTYILPAAVAAGVGSLVWAGFTH